MQNVQGDPDARISHLRRRSLLISSSEAAAKQERQLRRAAFSDLPASCTGLSLPHLGIVEERTWLREMARGQETNGLHWVGSLGGLPQVSWLIDVAAGSA